MAKFMKLSIPEELLSRDMEDYLLWHECKKINKNTFQTFPHQIRIAFEVFGISTYRMKRDFYDRLKVEGGKKAFSRQEIVISPTLDRKIDIRLTPEAYQFVHNEAKRRESSVSQYLRSFIERLIFKQKNSPATEKERRGQKLAYKTIRTEREIT